MKIKTAGQIVRALFINLGIVILLYGPFILAYQFSLWVRQGFWIEQVALYLFELPLSLILMTIGALVILVAADKR